MGAYNHKIHRNRKYFWRPWTSDSGNCNPESHPEPRNYTKAYLCQENPSCQAPFKRECDLKRHRDTKHSTRQEPCPVPNCPKKFTRKDNLTRHIKLKHSDGRRPVCSHCNKELSRRDAVQRHEGTCHRNPNKQSTSASPIPQLSNRVVESDQELKPIQLVLDSRNPLNCHSHIPLKETPYKKRYSALHHHH